MIKTWLDGIRAPRGPVRTLDKVSSGLLTLAIGLALGAFSKWLDLMSIDDTIWWQHIIGVLDLRNVFSSLAVWLVIALAISVLSKTPLCASLNVFLFFGGMCVSYHLYTVVFGGFNPQRYMLIWYALALLSPFFAFACWYGKGETLPSLILDAVILGTMLLLCFSLGLWYFDFRSAIDALLFATAVALLFSSPRQTLLGLSGGVILAFCARALF